MSYRLLDSFCLPGGQFEVVPCLRQLDNYIHLSGVRKSDSEVSHSVDPTAYHLPCATHITRFDGWKHLFRVGARRIFSRGGQGA